MDSIEDNIFMILMFFHYRWCFRFPSFKVIAFADY